MIVDILTRLRSKRFAPIPGNLKNFVLKNPDGEEAAAEIERLRTENTELRKSLAEVSEAAEAEAQKYEDYFYGNELIK